MPGKDGKGPAGNGRGSRRGEPAGAGPEGMCVSKVWSTGETYNGNTLHFDEVPKMRFAHDTILTGLSIKTYSNCRFFG